jgi:hypothetical protein
MSLMEEIKKFKIVYYNSELPDTFARCALALVDASVLCLVVHF